MLAIGLMSGTSMDGIDAALLETDGTAKLIRAVDQFSLSYTTEFHQQLKNAEQSCRLLPPRGDHLAELNQHSTTLHLEAVQGLLEKSGCSARNIDVIGYHGQTLYHRPEHKISFALGDGPWLAKQTGIPVVNNFRAADLAAGGQGAPLAPLFHQALAVRDSLFPLAVVNCGGIANVTFVPDANPLHLCAFDTGPGNVLIDRMIRQRTRGQELMDRDGKHGRAGKVNPEMLQQLYDECIQQHVPRKNNFFDTKPPKSLDSQDLQLVPALQTLSLADACRTLEAFTAETVVRSLDWLSPTTHPPRLWILAGGGWFNPVIRDELTVRLKARVGESVCIKTADEAGWSTRFMEAQLFAWLAVRRLKNLPLSVPGTTGAKAPVCGGDVHTFQV